MWTLIKDKINQTVQRSVPTKSVVKKMDGQRNAGNSQKETQTLRKWHQTRKKEYYTEYLKANNKATKNCRKAKRGLEAKVAAEAKSNPKAFWSYVKSKTTTKSGIRNLKNGRWKQSIRQRKSRYTK